MYNAKKERYKEMTYNRCGKSGLKLPAISLGLWHNFGSVDVYDNMVAMLTRAFDLGITHFDLANNYGPNPGSAEENFGKIMKSELKPYRDELIISSKAGYGMWPGPYGAGGSRKYLTASLDASLKRMGLEYVDIFYSHCFDPNTPLEETMGALDNAVRQGKALYVGISNYTSEYTRQAAKILRDLGTPCLIHQPRYSMFDRWVEDDGLLDTLDDEGMGWITFSPLAKGMLTDRYLDGIPSDSRVGRGGPFLTEGDLTDTAMGKVRALKEIADARGQALSQMAIAWVMRKKEVTSVLIGASKVAQIEQCVGVLDNVSFSDEELSKIESILNA